MIKYLQWLSISGVWGSLAAIAVYFALTVLLPSADGWGLAVLGTLLVAVLAHSLAVSALAGVCLLVSGKSTRVLATSVSSIIGGLVGGFILSRIYFGMGA